MVQTLLENLPYLIFVAVGLVAAIVIFIANLLNGKSFKQSINEFKENLQEMKFRTANYVPENENVGKQTFSPMKKAYMLNENTGELEELEFPVNVQEQINSHKVSDLNEILDKFLTGEELPTDVSDYYSDMSELDVMTEAYEIAEDFRQRYGMSDDVSFDEIISEVEKRNADMREKIKADYAAKIVGGVNNETQTEKKE